MPTSAVDPVRWASAPASPLSFVERRLLDKLMFWEGYIPTYGVASPAAGTPTPTAAE